MRHTILICLSINKEVMKELDMIVRNNPDKFHNRSDAASKMIKAGILDFQDGRFIDKLFGK